MFVHMQVNHIICFGFQIEYLLQNESKHFTAITLSLYLAKYTKENFGFTIGRVTGLDAAGPLFENCTKEVRIDKSDADFVDLIHTNGGETGTGICGIHAPLGHADFYPNGGVKQSGCGNADVECHHMRATLIYVDSINSRGCIFQACSLFDYEGGKCDICQTTNCNSMGFYAYKPSSDSTYYGITSDTEPYC